MARRRIDATIEPNVGLMKLEDRASAELGLSLTVQEVAEKLGISVEAARALVEIALGSVKGKEQEISL